MTITRETPHEVAVRRYHSIKADVALKVPFAEIGAKWGISAQRAQQIAARTEPPRPMGMTRRWEGGAHGRRRELEEQQQRWEQRAATPKRDARLEKIRAELAQLASEDNDADPTARLPDPDGAQAI